MTISANEIELQRRAAHLVSVNVNENVSTLVDTLAGGSQDRIDDETLLRLGEQAAELAAPIPDYEEAARESGATLHKDPEREEWCCWTIPGDDDDSSTWADTKSGAWREWCIPRYIEPHYREVFEHWIVTDWLADRLEAKGEKVDRNFAGLTIWARTTTGQAIAADWVIEEIARELHADLESGE